MVQLTASTESLEAEALYEALSDLLKEANEALNKEPVSQVHQHLRQAGFKKLPQLYKSAHKDMQVLRTLGELYIPVRPEAGSGVVDPPPYAGSVDHLGGITDKDLIASNSAQLGKKQGWHAELVPEVEARLEEKCKWLAGVFEYSGELEGLAEDATQQIQAVAAARNENVSTLLGLAEDLGCYLQLLSNFLEQQAAFVSAHKLTERREEDAVEMQALQAAVRAQMLKVHVIEKRLLTFTYTQQTMPALQAVSQHLDAAEQEAEATQQQLLARLGQYEELGPEFNTLAEKYQQILEDLRHAEFTLEELKQAAAAEAGAESP